MNLIASSKSVQVRIWHRLSSANDDIRFKTTQPPLVPQFQSPIGAPFSQFDMLLPEVFQRSVSSNSAHNTPLYGLPFHHHGDHCCSDSFISDSTDGRLRFVLFSLHCDFMCDRIFRWSFTSVLFQSYYIIRDSDCKCVMRCYDPTYYAVPCL